MRHKNMDIRTNKVKQNKDLSMLSKNQECCYSYSKDMQDIYSQLDYSRVNALCAIGSPYTPLCFILGP